MRFLGVILITLAMTSCDRKRSFDSEAALAWSKTSEVQHRQGAKLYSFQRGDGSWVSISTARMRETDKGLMYSGGEILKSGFITYPGGEKVESIKDAIGICSEINGSRYQPREAEPSNGDKLSN